jgi:midasin
MEQDFIADLSDISEDPEGNDSGDDDEDMNLDNQMGDTGDASEVVGKKSWDKDEDDDPKTSTEKYESGSSAKGTEQNDRELRAKDGDSVEDQDPMETDCDDQGKNSNLEDEPSPSEETDLNTDDVMNKDDAYDDRTGPELPGPENDFKDDVDIGEQEQNDQIDSDNEEIGLEEAEQAEERPYVSDDMEEGDPAQHGDNLVDNEGEHAEDANMETNNIDKQQMDETDSLMHPSQSMHPDNLLDCNRESESNLANSNDMNGAVAPSVNFSGDDTPNLEISMPNAGDNSRLLSNSKPEMQNDAPQSHVKQMTNPFRSMGDAMEDWKERAIVSSDTQDHQPENEHHMDDDSATEFRYVPEGEQSTSQALGSATAEQINDDTQIKQDFGEDETHVRKELTDERTGDDKKPEVPHLQASQAPSSKSKNDKELEGRELQADTSVQDFRETGKNNTFGDLVSFKRPLVDDKTLLDGLTIVCESPTHMDLDINDAQTESATIDWKNLELATMKLSQELAEQLRLVMEPTLASKLQGDYRTGKRINMKKVLLLPMSLSHTLACFLLPLQ